jgi:cation transport regulator
MPYQSNAELPPRVRDRLPPHAQDIFREAFNHAWVEYANDPRGEEVPYRIAWAAVKRRYRKIGESWVPIVR